MLLLIVGNAGQLCDLGAITFGTILFGEGVNQVNRRQRNDFRVKAVQALAIALLIFLVLTWVIAKRADSGEAGWIWAEFAVLIVLAIPTVGMKMYLDAQRSNANES